MELKESINSVKTIHEGKVTTYQLMDVTLPNGEHAEREIVRAGPAAAVIAFTDDEKMIFVRQYRVALEKTTLEIPAGLFDEGDQDAVETAKREFEEETGLRGEHWRYVTSFYATPGFCDEYLEIYEATGLKPVFNSRPQDDDEFIEVHAFTFEEAMDAYAEGELCDAKSVFALFYWQLQRQKNN